MLKRIAWALIAHCAIAAALLAQVGRGTITGTVTDSTGAVIPAVAVTARNADTGAVFPAESNELGLYSVLNLPIGKYDVHYKRAGFKETDRKSIALQIGQIAEINATLQVGEQSEVITVTDESPVMQTESAQVGTNLRSDVLKNLPLSARGGRYMDSFAYAFTPMVSGDGWSSSIGGSQGMTKQVLLDGTSLDSGIVGNVGESAPSMEAIAEFQVDTTGLSAESARTGGGSFQFAMKSGTNSFHGSAFGFMGNEILNANTWNNNWWKSFCASPGNASNASYATQCAGSFEKSKDRFFDYGGSVGGPILKNKTFFFVTLEKYQQADWSSNAAGGTVPTTAFLNGDFSALLDKSVVLGQDASGNPIYKGAIFDPATLSTANGQVVSNVFANNIIPQNRLSSRSVKIADIYRKSYQPANDRISGNYSSVTNSNPWFQQKQLDVKLDHNFTDKHHLSGSFIYSNRPRDMANDRGTGLWQSGTTDGGPLTQGWQQTVKAPSYRVQDSYSLRTNLLNVFSYTYNSFRQEYSSMAALSSSTNWADQVGLSSVTKLSNFPQIDFSGTVNGYSEAGIGNNRQATGYSAHNQMFNDSLTWITGRHTVKFGGEFRTIGVKTDSPGGGAQYTFNSTTGVPKSLLSTTAQTQVGFAFANFLLGEVDSASVDVPASQQGGRKSYGLFFEDAIKVSSRLTVVAGLRWDANGRLTESNGHWSNFDTDAVNPAFGGLKGAIAYLPGNGDSFERNQNFHQFGPHVGAAYKLTDKMVVRGSYGLSYVPIGNNSYAPVPYGFQTGYVGVNQVTTAGNNQPTFNWDSNAYPGQFQAATKDLGSYLPWGPVSISPDSLTLGRTHTWNANVQYELSKDTKLEVGYSGNIGRKLHDGYLDPRNYPTWSNYSSYLNGGANLGGWIWDAASAKSAGVPFPYSGFSNQASAALQPFPQAAMTWGPIFFANSPLGRSDYNAMVVQLTKRGGHGLNLDVSYTLARARGNAGSAMVDTWGGYGYGYQDPYAYASEARYATGSRHAVKGYVTYELPVGAGKTFLNKPGILDKIAGGWQLGVSFAYYSGAPQTAINSTNWYPGWSGVYTDIASGAKFTNTFQTPNLAWDPAKNGADAGSLFVNPSNFTNPTYGKLGNSPRIISDWTGWASLNEDLSILKNIKLGGDGRYHLQLRGEFFNVLNRHQYDGMNRTLSSDYFAHITGAGAKAPRTGQFGARFEF